MLVHHFWQEICYPLYIEYIYIRRPIKLYDVFMYIHMLARYGTARDEIPLYESMLNFHQSNIEQHKTWGSKCNIKLQTAKSGKFPV